MEQIGKYFIKILVFAVSFYALAVITRNYLQRKKGKAELMDSEVVFTAGIGAAIITMIATRVILKLFTG